MCIRDSPRPCTSSRSVVACMARAAPKLNQPTTDSPEQLKPQTVLLRSGHSNPRLVSIEIEKELLWIKEPPLVGSTLEQIWLFDAQVSRGPEVKTILLRPNKRSGADRTAYAFEAPTQRVYTRCFEALAAATQPKSTTRETRVPTWESALISISGSSLASSSPRTMSSGASSKRTSCSEPNSVIEQDQDDCTWGALIDQEQAAIDWDWEPNKPGTEADDTAPEEVVPPVSTRSTGRLLDLRLDEDLLSDNLIVTSTLLSDFDPPINSREIDTAKNSTGHLASNSTGSLHSAVFVEQSPPASPAEHQVPGTAVGDPIMAAQLEAHRREIVVQPDGRNPKQKSRSCNRGCGTFFAWPWS
eukprot:TRINITY_DN14583_c0_g1_i2.p1 TRINITY_DN14583_c0_g1~~TRINITY_DN14583_c0_g1_i2.p1  ORF type:complete len:357 (+),score=63.97 TRINITY_DN14583_c0_g1_i2:206-1276(+)